MIIRNKLRAFTMAETIVALGLIGILCVTMLSLNSMTDNNYKVASTQLAQADSALKSWGKAISKSNETGLGVTQVVNSQDSLTSSLDDFMNNQSVGDYKPGATIKTAIEDYNGSTEITLNNGVTLKVKYLGDGGSVNADKNVYMYDINESPIAIIKAEVEVKGKATTLEEEYALKADGVESLDSLYEGWDVYEYNADKTDEVKDGSRWFCKEKECIPSDNETTRIHVKTDSVVTCGSNQTGTITTMTIGTALGTYNHVSDTCCTSPKVFKEKKNNVNICVCPASDNIPAGYIADNSAECQSLVKRGAYAIKGRQLLCGHTLGGDDGTEDISPTKGFYCPEDGMSKSIECPRGYVCPNYSPARDEKEYHDDIFPDKDKKDEYLEGGLIDKVKCPAGYFCNEDGLIDVTDKDCPEGSYCPEGSIDPTKCPVGTYNDKKNGTKVSDCNPCKAGTYSNTEGAVTCKECDRTKGEYSKKGATTCSVCPEGTFLSKDNVCISCPAGTYQDTSGAVDTCIPCPKDTYQPKTGQTSCLACPEHSKIPEGTTDVTSIAACKCDAGWGVDEAGSNLNGTNFCKPAPIGTYSPEGDNTIFKCPANSTTEKTNSEKIEQCLCNAGYATDEAGTLQDKEGKHRCAAIEDFIHYSGNLDNVAHKCINSHTKQHKSTNIGQCLCDKGYGTDTKGTLQSKDLACTDVGIGFYSPDLDNVKHACPSHSSTKGKNSEKIEECLCDGGWGVDKAGTLQDAAGTYRCHVVEAGNYSPNLDNRIYDCEAGTYQDQVNQDKCKPCTLGHYCPTPGMTTPTACPCGMYQDQTGKTACTYCQAYKTGTYNPNTGSESATACLTPAVINGHKYEAMSSDGSHYCDTAIICNAGEKRTGQKTCGPCDCGTYNTGDNREYSCTTCSGNTYRREQGATSPSQCIAADVNMQATANHCDQVMACGGGMYKSYTLSNFRFNTPAGYIVRYGSFAANVSFTLGARTADKGYPITVNVSYVNNANKTIYKTFTTYETTKGTTNINGSLKFYNASTKKSTVIKRSHVLYDTPPACVACPCGTYNPSDSNHINVASCTACPNGTYFSGVGATSCTALPANRAATANKCSYYRTNCPKVCHNSYGCWQMEPSGTDGCKCPYIQYREVHNGHFDPKYIGSFQACGGGYCCTGEKWKVDPIVLDLNGNGLNLTSAEDGVIFDINSDGEKEQVAWTTEQTEFDDAFLCIDKNENGQIDDGSELFGEQQGEGAITGMDELAKYDINHDKKITKEDPIFENLLLWVDFNKNALVDYIDCGDDPDNALCQEDANAFCNEHGCTSEIKTLDDMHVTELSTENHYDYEFEYECEYEYDEDEAGNPVLRTNEDGNPIVKTDADGNPVYKLDDKGNKIIKKDADGNNVIKTDENGKYVVKADEHGNEIGVYGFFKRVLETGQEIVGKMVDAFFQTIQTVTEFVGDLFN
ncbi:MAG: hypothetical protein K6A44_06625 [bacterium]|nr:hypothetical protein [bacterium]